MIMKNDKCWDLMHRSVFMHRGYPIFTMVQTRTLRGRKTIIMVIIMLRRLGRKTIIMFILMLRRLLFLNRCPTSTATRECSLDKKGAQEVYELAGGSILGRVDHV